MVFEQIHQNIEKMNRLVCAYGKCGGDLFDLVKEDYYGNGKKYQKRRCVKCKRVSEIPSFAIDFSKETTRWD